MEAMRIAKFIAQAGICSRRDAEKLILAGRVQLNGKKVQSPNLNITTSDQVVVDGQLLQLNYRPRLWLYYKPARLVTTHKDPEGRKTAFEELPKDIPRVISVGRLDMFSEGLLLLTTNGDLAHILEHPDTQLKRIYHVCVIGTVTAEKLEQINKGVTIDGIHYRKIQVEVEKTLKNKTWLVFTLQEGKNREIRRISKFMGWKIVRLIRKSYGPFQLGSLNPGQVKEVLYKDFKSFLDVKNHCW